MEEKLQQYFRRLDMKVDEIRRHSRTFCETLHLTGFAYVRVYNDGRMGWLTSDSDHDRLLVDSGFLKNDPLVDTAEALKKGHYLWFHDKEFPGADDFYKIRTKKHHIDHGMVLVNHQKDYLETACFSGSLSQRPLYNLFTQELGLFKSYMEYFSENLPSSMLSLLEDGLHLQDIKASYGQKNEDEFSFERRRLILDLGWGQLLLLSKRELECLALLQEGLTYEGIGQKLHLSSRTIEHYISSVKNKLSLETQADLHCIANRLKDLGLFKEEATLQSEYTL